MCKHKWAQLLVRRRNKIVSASSLKVCLNCGELKIGKHTIRISKNRIDMDGKPIRNVSSIDISERLKIPVGIDKFS
jgi:ribosomal protein L32